MVNVFGIMHDRHFVSQQYLREAEMLLWCREHFGDEGEGGWQEMLPARRFTSRGYYRPVIRFTHPWQAFEFKFRWG